MNFRYLLLFAMLGALAACNGSDSSSPPADNSAGVFSDLNDKVASLNALLAGSEAKLNDLTSRIDTAGSGLGPVQARLDAALVQVAELGNVVASSKDAVSRLSGDGTKENPGEIGKARENLARLSGDAGATPGQIADAQKKLEDLQGQLVLATNSIGAAQDKLAVLMGTPDKPGEIAKLAADLAKLDSSDEKTPGALQQARAKFATLNTDVNTLTALLQDAQKLLALLNGDGTAQNPGEIAATKTKLDNLTKELKAATDELVTLEGNGTKENPGRIARAREEIAKLTAQLTALSETLRLQTARAKAMDLKAQNKVKEAALVLKDAGLLTEAAETLKTGGFDEDAYKLYAPVDYVLEDKTAYSGTAQASLVAAVDERPSVKRHKMELNGKTFWYTASAGHLTAYAKNPQKQNPQASIFYTAYTRDDLPKEKRPVTFFFNGGPGASSIYLHMASWAPKRAFLNGPEVKPEWAKEPPDSFPVIDDKESLIDKSDLVFVDIIPGTGYSQAIAPKTNKSFWGVTVDVELSRQFITGYVNANKRQASPKYLYGESYGGLRVAKLARALEEAGTGGFEPEKTGATPKVLTGVLFHSPALDYTANDAEAMFPTVAMTADYLKKSTARGGSTLDAYAQELRKFMTGTYWPALASGKNPDVSKYTPSAILALLNIGSAFNIYDTRMSVPRGFDLTKLRFTPWYDFSFFEERALNNVITKYLPDHVNYKTTSKYINASWKDWFNPSEGAWESWEGSDTLKNGLPDIVATIGLDPAVKLLTVHGYYDSATYFFRTELDLKGVVLDKEKNITLLDRVPVKNFAGRAYDLLFGRSAGALEKDARRVLRRSALWDRANCGEGGRACPHLAGPARCRPR